jgi:hypothetical protein
VTLNAKQSAGRKVLERFSLSRILLPSSSTRLATGVQHPAGHWVSPTCIVVVAMGAARQRPVGPALDNEFLEPIAIAITLFFHHCIGFGQCLEKNHVHVATV